MRVAIHQPNYIPWCGYFAKMRASDVFVFLDNVQMPVGRSYVYRSLIGSAKGPSWLSVPTHYKTGDLIQDVRFADAKWVRKHIGTLRANYGRSAYFEEVFAVLSRVYNDPGETLAAFNIRMIRTIADYLGLSCRFELSSLLAPQGESDDRLISLARMVGADTYVSGLGGQNYQDPAKFAKAEIQLDLRVYKPIPYKQENDPFVAGLSILDALFHLGSGANEVLSYSSDQLG